MQASNQAWRRDLAAAAHGFAALVGGVASGQWELPALGEWDVRGLVGHASRSLSLIGEYLVAVPPAGASHIPGPVEYYLHALDASDPAARRALDEVIAERGREAGASLGAEPASAVGELAARTLALVGATPGDALVTLRGGTMVLAQYAPTRTFELAVHSLDLARALLLAVPDELAPAVRASCELAGRLAAASPRAGELLLLLAGRPAAHAAGAPAPSVV